MNKLLSAVLLSAAGLFLLTSHASAAGFALPEQSASAMGMSSAFVGQADDASAVWYNPAGMTQLDGTRISGGLVAIYPTFTHENTDGTTDVGERKWHYPILLYATHKLNDSISLGFGVNNPFGLSTNWSPTSETSQVATLSDIKTTDFNPNIAVKVNDRFSVAAGVDFVQLDATLHNIKNIGILVDSRLSGAGNGWGGNVAALYKVSDSVSTGLSYRSRVHIKVDGTAELLGVMNAPASTRITLPDLAQWGVSYKASDKLTLNADLGYTWWSTYDKIVISSNNANFDQVTSDKEWKNVWNVRVGGQYKLSDTWKLRAGLQYDQNPVPDAHFETRVPDSDRYGVSVGTGYTVGNLTVDLAYLYLYFSNRNIADSTADDATTNTNSLNGTYKADVHVVAVNVGYKF
jgi:long-chain fatty acid transport protein